MVSVGGPAYSVPDAICRRWRVYTLAEEIRIFEDRAFPPLIRSWKAVINGAWRPAIAPRPIEIKRKPEHAFSLVDKR